MQKILLIFTGGTIGSLAKAGAIDTCDSAGFLLLELFAKKANTPGLVTFKTVQARQILSENLHPHDWSQMIAAIEAEDLKQFAGIILTHGTDTLAFSAAALGLYFHKLAIPMLLVSSDLPLTEPQANGLPNFYCAVDFILRIQLSGVFVAYQNPGQTMLIYRATRLASSLQLSSDFIGIQSKAFMQIVNDNFIQLDKANDTQPYNYPIKAHFSSRILLIRPYPGLDYTRFNLDGVAAVLHDLYHSGTACAATEWGSRHSLIEFIKQCRQRNINIYLAPALHNENIYSSTKELLSHGAEIIWNMSLEAAYPKLLLAYGNFDDTLLIQSFLDADIAFEHI